MRIGTLDALLKKANDPQAKAYVPGTYNREANKVAVVYREGGKVYTYKGTIHRVAQNLNLIPTPHYGNDGERIADELLHGAESVTGYLGSSSTVRHWYGVKGGTKHIQRDGAGVDEFDEPLTRYWLTESDPWAVGA